MHQVDFITTELGKDLIVSFAIASDPPGDVLSLTLLRTPEYEFILDPDERGVSVSWEEDEDEDEMLRGVERFADVVKVTATKRKFTLDVSRVRDSELVRMKKVLQKMNFDKKLKLTGDLTQTH